METWRRERNPDTGEISYIEGVGFFSPLASKLTGKTASKLASKAAEKLIEKGSEKIGEETGKLIGETVYDKFSGRKKAAETVEKARETPLTISKVPENKGKDIGEALKKETTEERKLAGKPAESSYIQNVYDSLL